MDDGSRSCWFPCGSRLRAISFSFRVKFDGVNISERHMPDRWSFSSLVKIYLFLIIKIINTFVFQ